MQYDASGTAVPRQALAVIAGAFCMPGPMTPGLVVRPAGCSLRPAEQTSCRAARTAHTAGLRQPFYQRRTDTGWASGQGVAPLNQLPTQTRRSSCR